MARPFVYRKLDAVLKSGDTRETLALGYDVMYGVKYDNDWVTVCKEDTYRMESSHVYRKYTRLFFVSETVAQTQANKLNKMFNTDKYRVVKVGEM